MLREREKASVGETEGGGGTVAASVLRRHEREKQVGSVKRKKERVRRSAVCQGISTNGSFIGLLSHST